MDLGTDSQHFDDGQGDSNDGTHAYYHAEVVVLDLDLQGEVEH